MNLAQNISRCLALVCKLVNYLHLCHTVDRCVVTMDLNGTLKIGLKYLAHHEPSVAQSCDTRAH